MAATTSEILRFSRPESDLVFLSLNGSRLYGTNREDSDYDYAGACIESVDHFFGLGKPFEQYEPKGDNYEGTVYSLKKYVNLLLGNNPTILATVFNPKPEYDLLKICTPEFRDHIVSQRAANAFFGYATQQLHRLKTTTGMHTTREHLVKQFGYDTKYASHVIRLARQGCEYLSTGHLTLPMLPADKDAILNVLHGGLSRDEFFKMAEDELNILRSFESTSKLPEQPDHEWVNKWLIEQYMVLIR